MLIIIIKQAVVVNDDALNLVTCSYTIIADLVTYSYSQSLTMVALTLVRVLISFYALNHY